MDLQLMEEQSVHSETGLSPGREGGGGNAGSAGPWGWPGTEDWSGSEAIRTEPGLPDVAGATLPSLFIANWTVALLGVTELIFYGPTPQQGLP